MSYSEKVLQNLSDNNLEEAQNNLKYAFKEDDSETLSSLAEELYAMGFTDQSQQVYRFLIKQHPKEDIFKVFLGELLLNENKETEGLSYLYDISEESDAYLQTLLVLADYYQTEGVFEAAEQKLKEAYQIDPEEPVIIFGLAELYYSMGQFQPASEYYSLLLDGGENYIANTNIQKRLGLALAKMGDYEEALNELKDLNDLEKDTEINYQLGLLSLQVNDDKQAESYLMTVLDEMSDYISAYAPLAMAQQHLGKHEEALNTAQAGLSYTEFDESLYQIAGESALYLKKYDTAQNIFEKGLAVNEDSQVLKAGLSQTYLRQKRYQAEIDFLTQLDEDQLTPQMSWDLARAYQETEQFEQAKSQYLLAYRAFSTDTDFLKQMLDFAQELADRELQLLLMQQYLKVNPDDLQMQNDLDDLQN
ncbi:tetratricopeptide repeat protein [Holzapfeliella floricola]|uniref:O-linked transferase n=1 Tax=Holzapfeliella floricola DSM 23037 = JCM 16512 TaxID=1423744 RepID=A0A0R2DKG2_9LACO|nr:tetratricopeptide repeat protein [Holzapfeliella floricola]KRN03659.1 O-linked transferase [Holzapfeliella floricola DSM 23037 = JCM 16512]